MNREGQASAGLHLFQALCIEPPRERDLQNFAGLHSQGRSLQSTLAAEVAAAQAQGQNRTTAPSEESKEVTAKDSSELRHSA